MKTFLAFALAAATLAIGVAIVTPMSGVAVAGDHLGPQYWCGAAVCPSQHPPWIRRRR
jgi:hypothetical protein